MRLKVRLETSAYGYIITRSERVKTLRLVHWPVQARIIIASIIGLGCQLSGGVNVSIIISWAFLELIVGNDMVISGLLKEM